jgi:hypothetical protein
LVSALRAALSLAITRYGTMTIAIWLVAVRCRPV